jgi:hypothetical protein
VRNLRAAGTAELAAKGKAPQPFRATEISAAERPPILTLYRGWLASSSRRTSKSLPDPADHPVFKIG